MPVLSLSCRNDDGDDCTGMNVSGEEEGGGSDDDLADVAVDAVACVGLGGTIGIVDDGDGDGG
jgi:hypothetical protein